MSELRFDGKVAIVTGSGAGLGRAYALLLAERGACVVVNDLGGGRAGDGSGTKAADSVVQEIKAKGGRAVADYNSVVDGDKIVESALRAFGAVHIVINNAGILRDRSFARIADKDWDLIHDVHSKGAFKVTQAAWPHMRKQNYGKVIFTSSNAGLCGNFGQANYSAAKMALVGLCFTLAVEGAKNHIDCNVIVPTAASRLTEDILPADLFAELKPELIAPVVVWLCHERCRENGSIIESAAGWATKAQIVRGNGALLRTNIQEPVVVENVAQRWPQVTNMTGAQYWPTIQDCTFSLMNRLEELKHSPGIGAVVSDVFQYTERDAIIYALGIGATTRVESDLRYLYEGDEHFSAFPTLAIIPGLMAVMSSDIATSALPDKAIDLSRVLHGEQYLELFGTMPASGKLATNCKLLEVLDKGKGATVTIAAETLTEDGEKLSYAEITTFIVGGGGFGGKSVSEKGVRVEAPPSGKPDNSYTQSTTHDQPALYRLSGDSNPLHIDPNFAALAGYERPILHGLCSLGFSVRHVLYKYADNDPTLFKAVKVRFAKPVMPGQSLKTDMWKRANRIHFQTTVVENGNVVLAGGFVDLHSVKESNDGDEGSASEKGGDEELTSDLVFAGMKERIGVDKSLLRKINGVFVYHITKNGKTVATWTADLKNGDIYRGTPKNNLKTDTTLTIDDADMVDMALGKLNPQVAFVKGKLKIKGDIMLTQKLRALMVEPKL